MERINNLNRLLERRRELRKNPTNAENILWECLRNKKLGLKFRRQHSVGGYILDFYCIDKKIVIEIDGEVHNSLAAKEYDGIRDRFFADLGFVVIRFTNYEVENDLESVLQKIKSLV